MKRVLFVFGTRPEAIKMAPVVKAFKEDKDHLDVKVCVTAQHRQMLDQVLEFFSIKPDFDLDLMKPNQTLHKITSEVILGLKSILEKYDPNYVFVHGDTTTSMAASIAGFYHGCTVCHVEAGLRTNNKKAPFPEEINRQVTGRIADIHFAPTKGAKENLLKENVLESTICITGNTVIDALLESVKKVEKSNHPEIIKLRNIIIPDRKIILVTGHRRENFGNGFLNICEGLKEIAENNEVQIIYPVHLNPNVQKPVYDILGNIKSINLIEPLSYESFVWLMNRAYFIITDSGGVQEEAPSLGKPVLVMRETTERPEAVEAGTVRLVGTSKDLIIREASRLINDLDYYYTMSEAHNPYGDGLAASRILKYIKEH